MKRAARPPEGPALFDLPLAEEAPRPARAPRKPAPSVADTNPPEPLPLFPEDPEAAATTPEEGESPVVSRAGDERGAGGASLASRRLRAGFVDLAALAAVLVILVVGVWAMGVPPRLAYWPAAAVCLATFSFLYHSLPLAFWGQTPAMAIMGLISRAADDQPLTFGQTALRWLGSTVTLLTAGLPLLLNLTGRSLADRLSGSTTRIS